MDPFYIFVRSYVNGPNTTKILFSVSFKTIPYFLYSMKPTTINTKKFPTDWPQPAKSLKVTLEEWVVVESAFNMRCHIVKNTLLHTAFSANLPAGKSSIKDKEQKIHEMLFLGNLYCLDWKLYLWASIKFIVIWYF